MKFRMIQKDLLRNKAVAIATIGFIAIAAALLSVVAILGTTLFGAIDRLMIEAKTPHFMQMHNGDLDLAQLERFAATSEDVEAFQIMPFLGIDSDKIQVEGKTLTDSLQDNGFCTQSKQFDFLLDMDGNRVKPKDGELYVPVFYSEKYDIKPGDTLLVADIPFAIAGFIRDSQMNSALAYSKRFVVSENDYARLVPFGKVEQLIEFRLKNIENIGQFSAAYSAAGMPANGPTLTWELFRMLSAISDGILIAVILLIGLLVTFISLLCVRFTLLAKIEDDYREIGTMKAIGMCLLDIRKLYLLTYGGLAGMGCVIGLILSMFLYQPLHSNIRLIFGAGGNIFAPVTLSATLVLALFFFILLYVRVNLQRLKKLSAVQAIRFGVGEEQGRSVKSLRQSLSVNLSLGLQDVLIRKRLYITLLIVAAVSAFIIIVPQNLYHTISSRGFVSYMGVGRCDLRMDIQQGEDTNQITEQIASDLSDDASLSAYSVLTTKNFSVLLDNGNIENSKVELGNHDIFPVACVQGNMPQTTDEIALSSMNAQEWEKSIGDTVTLLTTDGKKSVTVCGIYSDITNGGKTAKAAFTDSSAKTAWSVISVSLANPQAIDQKLSEYQDTFPSARVTSIEDYITETFGQTLSAVKTASLVAVFVAIAITLLVILLFLKLLITKDRYSIAVLKVIGFTNTDIKRQFAFRMLFVLFIGILLGTIFAGTLGEQLASVVISSFGTAAFRFEVNIVATYLFCPLTLCFTALIGIIIGTEKVGAVHISNTIKES